MKAKIIEIEGTDCSGKKTQTDLLKQRLEKQGYRVASISFPCYDDPTGKIIGGPYLGKKSISDGWFKEGIANVDPRVSGLYYAADRRYHLEEIKQKMEENDILLLDRYTFSNFAHQGSKLKTKEERLAYYQGMEELEFHFLELPRPDLLILLYMPALVGRKLRLEREEPLDLAEQDIAHLKAAEEVYLELAFLYGMEKIDCAADQNPKSIEEISLLLVEKVNTFLEKA